VAALRYQYATDDRDVVVVLALSGLAEAASVTPFSIAERSIRAMNVGQLDNAS
jgi:hypothetical protein